jgi:hypothetical protein
VIDQTNSKNESKEMTQPEWPEKLQHTCYPREGRIVMENFKIVCLKCNSEEVEIDTDDNGACGDPECCGERAEWSIAHCVKCGNEEKIE